MIQRIAIAAIYGAAAWLICILIGMLLTASGIPVATTLGAFLERFAVAIAFLVAAAKFFGVSIFGL